MKGANQWTEEKPRQYSTRENKGRRLDETERREVLVEPQEEIRLTLKASDPLKAVPSWSILLVTWRVVM